MAYYQYLCLNISQRLIIYQMMTSNFEILSLETRNWKKLAPQIDPRFESHQCLLASMWIRIAQLPCWLPRDQQVSCQRWIWGCCCMQVTKHASKEPTLALKPGADNTRSPKQGYQWPHKKDWCPPKIKQENKQNWQCSQSLDFNRTRV